MMVKAGGDTSQSTGLAVVTGSAIKVIKDTADARTFSTNRNVAQLLDTSICLEGTNMLVSIIGHCHTVMPKAACIDDIHPVVCNSIVGVHSGYAANHADLFHVYGLKRTGTYHGEIVFRLINYLYHNCRTVCEQPLSHAAGVACRVNNGTSTSAFVCKDNPYLLWLSCCSGELFIRHYEDIGLIVFADDLTILSEIDNRWSLDSFTQITLKKRRIMGINLFSGSVSNKNIDESVAM